MRKHFPSLSALAAIALACVSGPPALGQITWCPVTTQVPTGNPVATMVVDMHTNDCYSANGGSDPAIPCCPSAASVNLPAGSYIVTVHGNLCSTESGTCNYDGTGTGGGPAWLPIAWGAGSCASHSSANCCFTSDPGFGVPASPFLLNHPGGPVYAWRNDNYWGDNYGLVTISFYSVLPPLVINTYAGLTISGQIGATFQIQCTANLNSPDWTTLTNLTLPTNPYLYFDATSAGQPRRFYRAVPVP